MSFSSLPEWLTWLEQCHPREIDLGLERVSEVAARLHLPHGHRSLVVAGTNGKGSCVAASSALLQCSGLRVGSYTSPHLLRYNERICVDGIAVDDELICRAFSAINRAQGDISLTYFEVGTLAALWIFRELAVDIAVLEVGLGGRLDAVNIVDAEVTVVTSIDIDHESWLGSDRETIGREKAGIFRAGVPAICADPAPPASLQDCARNVGAHWLPLGESFSYQTNADGSWNWQAGEGSHRQLPALSLPLPSVAAALMALDRLGVTLSTAVIARCLSGLTLPGRMQKMVFRGRQLLLDVAHNPSATAYLASKLEALPSNGQRYAIVAMMADKDIAASLAPMVPQVDHWALALLADVPRAASPGILAGHLAAQGVTSTRTGTLAGLLEEFVKASSEADTLVIFGSFFTVSAALAIVAEH